MKHVFASILAVMLLCLPSAAGLADSGAPTSQFGFKGWPYRQSTPCRTTCGAECRNSASANAGKQGQRTPAQPSSPAAENGPSVSTGDYTTLSLSAQEKKLLNLLNEDREKNGLSPLTEDPALSALARTKSQDMNDNHYFAHESPTYGNAAQMLTDAGYAYNGVGENIAHHASVEKAEAAFMSSDGHRRNILGSQWTKVGVGVAADENNSVYVTELFAR